MNIEATARAKWVRITPRKMRLVADMVRGKPVRDAMNALGFSLKRAAVPIDKAVRSALANMMQMDEASKLSEDQVFIKTIMVDEGPTLKRWRPRAMGRATRIRKRTSHLTVILSSRGTLPSKIKKS